MARRKKDDDKGAGDGTGTDDKGTGGTDDGDGESVEETVRRVLAEVLDGMGLGSGGGGDDKGGDDKREPVVTDHSPAGVERAAEDAVRRAMEHLRKEEANDKRLGQLEKAIKEEAPAQVRKITSWMWGADDRKKAGAK